MTDALQQLSLAGQPGSLAPAQRGLIRRYPMVALGGLLFAMVVLITLAAPWLATHDPQEIDPIARLRTYLVEAGAWSKADEERLVQEINGEIDAAVERYLKTRPQPPEAMFDYLYAQLPRALAEQRAAAAASAGDHHA